MARAKKLTPEELKERDATRVKAMNYATQFIRNKYKEEYKELYAAYLRNRGIDCDYKPLVDERVN